MAFFTFHFFLTKHTQKGRRGDKLLCFLLEEIKFRTIAKKANNLGVYFDFWDSLSIKKREKSGVISNQATLQAGFEPATRWLTAICSATELLEILFSPFGFAFIKPFLRGCKQSICMISHCTSFFL